MDAEPEKEFATQPRKPLSLSVFFPCHNEQAAIEPLVRKTHAFLNERGTDFEIILVDDGSTDETPRIADRLADEMAEVRVVHHARNGGYGAALQSGFRAARKDLVFYTDGDGQFDITEIAKLLPLIDSYDIVSAYRLNRQEGRLRKFNAWAWTRLVNAVFGLGLRDIDCAFKLFKREVFDRIEMHSTGALIDTEILARATRRGYTVTQVGVHHYPRTGGSSSGASPAVIARAFRELFRLRKRILRDTRP